MRFLRRSRAGFLKEETLNKTQLIQDIQTRLEVDGVEATRGAVTKFLDALEGAVTAALVEGDPVTIAGFVKFSVQDKPATEAGERINPFTKEMQHFEAKPASKRVKVGALARLKKEVQGA